MKLGRGLLLHFALLAAALVLALFFWLRDERPDAKARQMVQVWPGSPEQVERISWESEKANVMLEAKQDEVGRWFVGSNERTVVRLKESESEPEAGAPAEDAPAEADAGAARKPTSESRRETTRFVSVGVADKLARSLAPLQAFRAIGQLDAARAAEFGFDKPAGTVRVTIAGQQHGLIIGGATPGAGGYYAKHEATGQVYAVPGEIGRNLMHADSRLLERDLHEWKMDEISRVVVAAGDARRELVRVEGKKGAWADPSNPSQQDETAGNWMSKLDMLRTMKHVQQAGPAQAVVRVEYFDGQKPRGFAELARRPGTGKHPEYLVRTEYTRWHAMVFRSTAEELEQDLGSVFK